MFKSNLSLSLVLSLGLSMLTATVSAKDVKVTVEGAVYVLQGKNAILDDGSDVAGDFVIPESVTKDGTAYKVTEVANKAFQRNKKMRSVDVNPSVKTLGRKSFAGCAALEEVILHDGLKTIDASAFESCKVLETINVPASVTKIGTLAFAGGAVSAINVDTLNTVYGSYNGVLYDRNFTTLIQYPAVKADASFIVPDGVLKIEAFAFSGNSKLMSVTLPDGLLSIGSSCFNFCTGLTTVSMPNSITEIPDWCFRNCKNLVSINMPMQLVKIDNLAFELCSKLVSIQLPPTLVSIDREAFHSCDALARIEVMSKIPPVVAPAAFDDFRVNTIHLYVPKPFVREYEKNPFWGRMKINR